MGVIVRELSGSQLSVRLVAGDRRNIKHFEKCYSGQASGPWPVKGLKHEETYTSISAAF